MCTKRIAAYTLLCLAIISLLSYLIHFVTIAAHNRYGYFFTPSEEFPDLLYLLTWASVIGLQIGLLLSILLLLLSNFKKGAKLIFWLRDAIFNNQNIGIIIFSPVGMAFVLAWLVLATLVTSWGAAELVTVKALCTIAAVLFFIAFGSATILAIIATAAIPFYIVLKLAEHRFHLPYDTIV